MHFSLLAILAIATTAVSASHLDTQKLGEFVICRDSVINSQLMLTTNEQYCGEKFKKKPRLSMRGGVQWREMPDEATDRRRPVGHARTIPTRTKSLYAYGDNTIAAAQSFGDLKTSLLFDSCPHKILTAAHCVDGDNRGLTVVSGTTEANKGQVHNVTTIVIHPGYSVNIKDAWKSDIAVITLAAPIKYNQYQSPIALTTSSSTKVGIPNVTLSGYGRTIYECLRYTTGT
ncbi:trypsin-like cysteine/serine peptidase domain-containing protein [Mycena leptocephala]|nr:trypsin-like cysteine/serine peptidase domain-containing protein [Mycena leptocephala]